MILPVSSFNRKIAFKSENPQGTEQKNPPKEVDKLLDNNLLTRSKIALDKFTKAYEKFIAKNRIHEAKLTNNAEIFEKYLINQKYCNVVKTLPK